MPHQFNNPKGWIATETGFYWVDCFACLIFFLIHFRSLRMEGSLSMKKARRCDTHLMHISENCLVMILERMRPLSISSVNADLQQIHIFRALWTPPLFAKYLSWFICKILIWRVLIFVFYTFYKWVSWSSLALIATIARILQILAKESSLRKPCTWSGSQHDPSCRIYLYSYFATFASMAYKVFWLS